MLLPSKTPLFTYNSYSLRFRLCSRACRLGFTSVLILQVSGCTMLLIDKL